MIDKQAFSGDEKLAIVAQIVERNTNAIFCGMLADSLLTPEERTNSDRWRAAEDYLQLRELLGVGGTLTRADVENMKSFANQHPSHFKQLSKLLEKQIAKNTTRRSDTYLMNELFQGLVLMMLASPMSRGSDSFTEFENWTDQVRSGFLGSG